MTSLPYVCAVPFRRSMPLDTTTRMLAPFLDRLSHEELDAIPYGVIQLDANGVVRSYNRVEAANVGGIPRPIGRNFFRDICPSANVPELFGRFAQGIDDHKLDDTFQYTFSCGDAPRRVLLRMYYSVRTRSVWMFIAKPDGSPLDRYVETVMPMIRPTPSHGIDLRAPRVA
jgi:photoactive yellow protein